MTMPSPEEMVARIREAEWASAFVQQNYETLGRKYPDQHFALRDGEVVAVGCDPWDLVESVEAAGLGLSDVWTFCVPADPMQLLP